MPRRSATPRQPRGWLRLAASRATTCTSSTCAFPLGVFTTVTGVSGSGKSSLVSQVLVELVADHLGHHCAVRGGRRGRAGANARAGPGGRSRSGMKRSSAWCSVDQKPIGRTPRSNLATYTGLFDHVRKLFAATNGARAALRRRTLFVQRRPRAAARQCEGEGSSSWSCSSSPACMRRARRVTGRVTTRRRSRSRYRDKNIAEVLGMTVDAAWEFFAGEPHVARRSMCCAKSASATCGWAAGHRTSGGEAQRIKLATELQRAQRGNTLYILDEPTTGPASVGRGEAHRATRRAGRIAGNTVIVVEHDMRVVAGSDWVIDMGPGAGDEGGRLVACGLLPRYLRTQEAEPRLTWRASKPREAVILPHVLLEPTTRWLRPEQKWTVEFPCPPLSDGTMRSSIHQPSPAPVIAV